MTVGAELGNRRRSWRLGVGIMACLALNIRCMMGAGAPFIGGGLMAGAAQLRVWPDRHRGFWVTRLERSVAGFARNPFMSISAICDIVAGGMAFQAGKVRAYLCPIALKDRR